MSTTHHTSKFRGVSSGELHFPFSEQCSLPLDPPWYNRIHVVFTCTRAPTHLFIVLYVSLVYYTPWHLLMAHNWGSSSQYSFACELHQGIITSRIKKYFTSISSKQICNVSWGAFSDYSWTSVYYPATNYLDISIIRLRYCLLFINFRIKSCSKQKQSGLISVLFHSMSIFFKLMMICHTCNYIAMSATCLFINPTELAVFKHAWLPYLDKSLIWIEAGPNVAG